jgi:hypothetical protein
MRKRIDSTKGFFLTGNSGTLSQAKTVSDF